MARAVPAVKQALLDQARVHVLKGNDDAACIIVIGVLGNLLGEMLWVTTQVPEQAEDVTALINKGLINHELPWRLIRPD
jgi:hypothetical protein